MPKDYRVEDILDEFEAKRRPRAQAPAEAAPPTKQPFKLKSFEDTAEIFPKRLREQSPPADATRLDIPVATGEIDVDLSRTMVIDKSAVISGDEDIKLVAEQPVHETPGDRRERFKKFASVTSLAPDDDIVESDEDEEAFMAFGRKAKKDKKRKQKALDAPVPADEEGIPVVDEYGGVGDAKLIERDLASLRTGLMVRFVVSLVGFVLLTYFSLLAAFGDALPLGNMVAEQPMAYMLIQVGLLALLMVVSNKVVGGGILSLVRLRASGDTPLAFASLAGLGLGVALAVNPGPLAPGYCSFYFASLSAGFLFNALGKLSMVGRIARNFELVQREDNTLIVPLSEAIGGHLGGRSAVIPVRATHASDYLAIAYSDDLGENLSRITAPIFLGFSAVVGVISFFLYGDGMLSLTAFAAMLTMAAPLTATLCGNLPLSRASKQLNAVGAALCGHSAIDQFEETDAMVLEAGDLFPGGSMVLHGIKTFAEGRIDEAIVDAASVMCAVDGLLAEVFLQVVGGRRDLLRRVSDYTYDDNRGIHAKVEGRDVFIGNRELMRANGIAAPSRDYEEKFIEADKDILYLAGATEVTAMFVVSYHPDERLAPRLKKLTDRGVMLLVKTNDPNVDPARVAQAYGLRPEHIKMVPYALATTLPDREIQETAPAYILGGDTILSKLRAVAAVHTVRGSVMAATFIQLIGMLIGYALIAFFSFMGSVDSIGFLQILIYQLFWALLSTVAANMGST